MNICIIEEECTGCEYCADKLPTVFILNENGISSVSDVTTANADLLHYVIENCPAQCILFEK